jgi:NMD protein affecting ribosome stability and mRNA decay
MKAEKHCEFCGEPMDRPRNRPVCGECWRQARETLKTKRRRERLDSCGHVAMDLGPGENGRHVEYHISKREMAEVAQARLECGMPSRWNGKKWVWPEGS